MQKRLLVVVVIALVIAAGIVYAAGPRGGNAAPVAGKPGLGMGPGCGLGLGLGLGPGIMRNLNLTADQVKQLQAIRDDFLAATKSTRDELAAKAKGMAPLWTADQPNAAAIKALFAEMDLLRAELRDAGVDYAIRALSVLTPAQREKIGKVAKDCIGCCMGMGMGCGLCCGGGMGMGPGPGNGPGMGRGNCPFAK